MTPICLQIKTRSKPPHDHKMFTNKKSKRPP
ncbi:hypothetical protein T07_24 [Trichinella nelsoni]|uniref:Uncharacterized protein n=1 Tax=Trichinella nelsoni TaxID=6336 RepID=A0A0V0R9V5_9BILA|nr:hypothetical protein T07_24 [Trichinella nelsoni]